MRHLLLLFLPFPLYCGAGSELATSLHKTDLDSQQCYRVRDLTLVRDEAKIFLTDGYLIFGKPAGGRRISAVFSSEVEGGDAEVLLLPPNRGERKSLASYIGAPTLSEHITAGVFLFSDDTYDDLMRAIHASPYIKKVDEMGPVLAEKWAPVLRNITASFESRLTLDLLTQNPKRRGFFAATVSGKQLGNFDIVYDPRSAEQLLVGQFAARNNQTFLDIWTSFRSSTFRNAVYEPEFRVSDYRISATLDPDLTLKAVTRVKIKLSGAIPERALPFDISQRMDVTAATVDGEPAEVFQRESVRENLFRNGANETIVVIAPKLLDPEIEHEVELQHSGKVVFDAGHHVYFVGSRGNWYPGRGQQFALFDLTFRYPRTLDLVSAGEVMEDKIDGEWKVTRRATGTPIRLAGFNLGMYQREKIVRGEFTIEVCANRTLEEALQPPVIEPALEQPHRTRPQMALGPEITAAPDPLGRLKDLAVEVAAAMEFYTARFGPPPLRSIEVSPVPGTFGQGFAGMIYLSTLSYLRPSERVLANLPEHQKIFFAEMLYAHEAAHQWWGNIVTSADYHDDWIMEALANYSALLYVEKHRGFKVSETALEEYRRELLAKTEGDEIVDSIGPLAHGSRLENSQHPGAWTSIIYGKGTWVMHMLRRRMGDERFLRMLRQLRKRYEYRPISTPQFQALCAEFMPPHSPDPKLDSFFEQWVYGTGIPALQMKSKVARQGTQWNVSGTVTQRDVDDDFSVEVPIEVQFGKTRTMHVVRSSSEPVSFSFGVPTNAAKVSLDPQNGVLKR